MVKVRKRGLRGLVGTPLVKQHKPRAHKPRRKPIPPSPMPAFGRPAASKQCRACGDWFPWRHFNRAGGRTVERCVGCIQARRTKGTVEPKVELEPVLEGSRTVVRSTRSIRKKRRPAQQDRSGGR